MGELVKPADIELWARSVIERVQRRQPVEDVRVELKSEWLDNKHYQIARRIAGHANAARGEPILWLIGLKEGAGVVGADHMEFASWWRQVSAHFDPPAPRPYEVGVPIPDENKTVVAILFETDRAPFVVQNPHFNQTKGEIKYEVPWREGTSVRTATRADLLRILVPQQRLPRLEILWGELHANAEAEPGRSFIKWRLETHLFVEQFEGRIVIPRHRCAGSIEVDSERRVTLSDFSLEVDKSEGRANAIATNSIAHFLVPGVLVVHATQTQVFEKQEYADWIGQDSVRIELLMRPTGADSPASIQFDMRRILSEDKASWSIGERIQKIDEYEEWVEAIENALSSGPENAYPVKVHERAWAARAIRDGRLSWMPGVQSMLTLPHGEG